MATTRLTGNVTVKVTNPESPFGGVVIRSNGASEGGADSPDIPDVPDIPVVGATDFLELTDTPKTYAGQAGKMVVVRADETGLEFADVPTGGDSSIVGTVRVTTSDDRRVTTADDFRVID